jgi:hypothetical protein
MCRGAFGGQEKIPGHDVASGIFREPPKRDAERHPLREEIYPHQGIEEDYESVVGSIF